MAKKPVVKPSTDFGFSLMSEADFKQQDQHTVDKVRGLRDMIMPFLNNLTKNPEKEYIMWPDRAKKVEEFIKKINDYVDND